MRALFVVLPIAFSMLASGTAMAQFANPNVALAGRAGAMTCGEFTHMSPRHRDNIVRQLNGSAAPASLAPMIVTPNMSSHGRRGPSVENLSPVAPLTAGALVAACQTASAGESLRSAYDSAYSSHRPVRGRR